MNPEELMQRISELKDYFDKMLAERTEQAEKQTLNVKEVFEERFRGIAMALEKSESESRLKFAEANNVRQQIDSERNLLARREYVDNQCSQLRESFETNIKNIRDDLKKLDITKDGQHAAMREYFDSKIDGVASDIKKLETFQANLTGKLSIIGGLIFLVNVVVMIVLRYVK